MKITVEFEDGDFDSLHDIVFELSEKSLSHKELEALWNTFPQSLKDDGLHWGLTDSVVRDNMYVHLENSGEWNTIDTHNEDEHER